jgi:hypothetical protein
LDEAYDKWKNLSEQVKIKYLKRLKSENHPFFSLELQVAAHVFDQPIIEFSDKHKMAFFDRHFKAKTIKGNKKRPLFLYNKSGYYQYLDTYSIPNELEDGKRSENSISSSNESSQSSSNESSHSSSDHSSDHNSDESSKGNLKKIEEGNSVMSIQDQNISRVQQNEEETK